MPHQFIRISVPHAFFTLLLSALLLVFPSLVRAGDLLPAPVHHLFLDPEGKLWGWGDNSFGQLGREGASTRLPVPIDFAVPVISAAAGKRHSVAVDNAGSVWVWGDNSAGQLGTGDFKNLSHPSRLDLTSVVAVAAGAWHTVALDMSGHVWSWGGNTLGQLGSGQSGKFSVSVTPRKIEGLDAVVAIRSGDFHILALRADGTVWSWGGNQQGQLGAGDKTTHERPAQIAALTKVRLIRGAGNASGAEATDGTAWVWGRQVGTTDEWLTPRPLKSPLSHESEAAFRMSGRVNAGGLPVDGAVVTIDNEVCGTTDRHGAYQCWLPAGFEGVLQAQKEGFDFVKAKISPISEKLTGQNIRANAKAIKLRPELALKPKINTASVAPVSHPAVSHNPIEMVREKEPINLPSIAKREIAAPEVVAQPAIEVPALKKEESPVVTVKLGGTIRLGVKGQPVSGVEIEAKGAECSKTDIRGEYVCAVPAGWSGRVGVLKHNYRFSPSSITYRDVRGDRADQDFTAIFEPD